MNPCSEHHTPAACAAAGCPNAINRLIHANAVGVSFPAPQATGEQHDGEVCQRCKQRPQMIGEPYCSTCWGADWKLRDRRNVPPPDRGAVSLGALDAHGLAALRAIILRVIDDGHKGREWRLSEYESDDYYVTEAEADADRLDFCDAVAKAVIDRCTPAVRYRPAFWQKSDDPLTCRQCDQHLNEHGVEGQLCPRRAAPATQAKGKRQ